MPRETFKARARCNDEERERERERESTSSSSSSKARSVFLSPLFKTTLRKTRPKEQRKKKRTDANNAAVVAAVTAALESFSDKLDAWTTVLLTELLCCVVLMTTKSIKTREVSVRIQTSRGGCHHRFSLSISPKEESVLYKTKKRTIVIQRVTPSREDQMHVPFGGNLVYGNLLAS